MKTLHLSIIITSLFFILFLTSHVYAQCTVVNGKSTCMGMNPYLVSIKSDKLVYENSDKPVITIYGVPNKVEYLEIDDHSGNIIFSHNIELPPTGILNYTLDISSYKPDVYSANVNTSTGKITTSFAVGLVPSGGTGIILIPSKLTYVPNETILITGFWNPNTMINLDLVDPTNQIKKSALLQSDSVGNFTEKIVVPNDAINGTWQVRATSGFAHTILNIFVMSQNFQQKLSTQNLPVMEENMTLSRHPAHIYYDFPLRQLKSGIAAKDVKCNDGFQLIIKSEDNSTACVKADTAQKLIERGWAENSIGVSSLEKPSIALYNVTASLQPIILGMSFFVNAEITNNQNTPITYYGGCVSPLSISFDNIQTHTNDVHCLAISKYILGPHEQVSIQSDKIYTVYNGTGPDHAHAELKFTYENNGTQASWFASTQFPIQHAIKLTCTKPFQAQMEEINTSVNVQKAIALAHSSPEFLSKVKQYGNVSYMSFYNDLFPDQSCNAYWKGIEVMFTANDKNGVRNIQVYEDINLTKVIKIEDFQAFTN